MICFDSLAPQNDFENLLRETKKRLHERHASNPFFFTGIDAYRFEDVVLETLMEAKNALPFIEGTISKTGRFKFPDIQTSYRYGVEVKSVKSDKWKSTANSVLEETRVDNIEHIYVIFGKLTDNADFIVRKYEDCIYDVSVTHSPRYVIDMELKQGKSIFDQMGFSYDVLRKEDDFIQKIMSYLSKKHSGKQLWYLQNDREFLPYVEYWNDLGKKRKKEIILEAFCRFPEILGNNRSKKFKRLSAWMVASHNVLCTSLRDIFTAGGRVSLSVNGVSYNDLPRIFKHLNECLPHIVSCLDKIPLDELAQTWNKKNVTNDNLVQTWKSLVKKESKSILSDSEDYASFVTNLLQNL